MLLNKRQSLVLALLTFYFFVTYFIDLNTSLWSLIIAAPGIFLLAKKDLTGLIMLLFASMGFIWREPAPFELLFLITLLGLLVFNNLNTFKKIFKSQRIIHYSLGLIVIGNLISLTNSISFKLGLIYILITFYLIALFYLARFLGTNSKYYKLIVQGYLVGAFVTSVIGLTGLFTSGNLQDFLTFGVYRIRSTFQDPNVFGSFLIPAVIILLGELKKTNFTKLKGLPLIFATTIIILALILSFSRAAWLTLFFGVLIFIILSFKTLTKRVLISYFLVAALTFSGGFALLKTTESIEFFYSRFGLAEYDKERFAFQKSALEFSGIQGILSDEEKKLVEARRKERSEKTFLTQTFGIGPGQYELEFNHATHNSYLRVLAENGLFSLLPYLIFLAYLVVNAYKAKDRPGGQQKSTILLPIILSLLITGLFIDTLHWRHFWVFAALGSINET